MIRFPRVNTKHGKGCTYYATNTWNKLPEALRLAPTDYLFITFCNTPLQNRMLGRGICHV